MDSSGKTDDIKMLEKINKSVETAGLNIILEWETGDDLDIHTKCACTNWTETFNIYCIKCSMTRDFDMQSAPSNRKRKAMEHIIYSKPDNLVGKELGVYVQNFQSKDRNKEVKFNIKVVNKYGKLVWPEEGTDAANTEWMKCPPEAQGRGKSESTRKAFTYTQEMHDKGVIRFEEHLKNIMRDKGEADWDINKNRQLDAKNSEEAETYRKKWNEKWQLVKETLCGPAHYNCEVLQELTTEYESVTETQNK